MLVSGRGIPITHWGWECHHSLRFQTPRTFKAVRHRAARRSNAMAECSPPSAIQVFFCGHLEPQKKTKNRTCQKRWLLSKHTGQHSSVKRMLVDSTHYRNILRYTPKTRDTSQYVCFPEQSFNISILIYGKHVNQHLFFLSILAGIYASQLDSCSPLAFTQTSKAQLWAGKQWKRTTSIHVDYRKKKTCLPSRERSHIPPWEVRIIIIFKTCLLGWDMWSFPGG